MRYLIVAFMQLLLISMPVCADIVVVVSPSSELRNLTKQEVIDIYMGRIQVYTDGIMITPYDQPLNSKIRADFYQRLTNRPVASVDAYWARLLFTGRAAPPRQAPDNISIIEIIEENPRAIGYIEERELDDRVSVVFKLIGHE